MKLPTLLKSPRFLPLFITQFLGAFNDNLFKNAFVALVTYRIAEQADENAALIVTLSAAIFILPFFLFSAMAGQCADKFDKAMLARFTKMGEIIIMTIAAAGFYLGDAWFLQFVLFCLGIQAAFFGPIKYALLPQHLHEEELISGNAYIEAGTFLAILLGTILGELLVLHSGGVTIVSTLMLLCAVGGYYSSRHIPAAPPASPDLKVSYNLWSETWRIVGASRKYHDVFLSILGNSWFWFVGATFLTQFPSYAKDVLHGDATVFTLLLTMFSVGIGLGSFLCNKLLKGQVQATYVPPAAIGITLFTIDLFFASHHAPLATDATLFDVWEFLSYFSSWRILLDLLLIAICGGIYIVPLYAIMQERSDASERARVIASNNILNALFMVGSAILTLTLFQLSFSIPGVFLTIAILNGFVAVYICKLLPDAILRALIQFIFARLYRVDVKGIENFATAGSRVLIVANHTSFLDAALIAAYLPEKITFAINTHMAKRWWIKPFLMLVDAFPLDATNPLATKALIDAIKKGRKCMIFPEGRITVTGSLMKIYEGPGMIAEKAGAKILPIHIDGAQFTPFSYLKGKVHIRWFPKITLTLLPPRTFHVADDLMGRKRRHAAGAQLYDIMSRMMFDSSNRHETLFEALISARKLHGGGHIIAEDIERKPISYFHFLMRSFILGRRIHALCVGQPTVGILLPSAISTALTFFGLLAYGRTAAMLNFTAGSAQITLACRSALITTVLTSRRFVHMAKLEHVTKDLSYNEIKVIYLEDLREKVGSVDTLLGLIAAIFPSYTLTIHSKAKADDAAVILFTSGSEGTPKGVVLSHANIQANRFQLADRIDFGPQDKVFNCLPMFHAFGLTAATLLPLLSGIRTFYYPSPLHYRIVPELIYDTNATILFGTDTFLAGYVRMGHPYDLHTVRYVFAGAEKLKEETRKAFAEKFGVRIFEGYGATETSPALSTNTPMQNRTGTVGRLLPGIECKVERMPGIDEGGKLWVKGPNIMLGYLRAERPGILETPREGWYDTGDIVTIDRDGYISVLGRTKRFAKIGGEMISLTAVEAAIGHVWPEYMHAAVTVPDPKKGEQITLLTDNPHAVRDALMKYFRESRMPELALPRKIIIVPKLPLLGTGKIDYIKAKALAIEEEKSQKSFL